MRATPRIGASEPAVCRNQEGEVPPEPVSSILGGRAYSRADIGLPVSGYGLQVPPHGSARLCPSRFHPSWEGECTREPILGWPYRVTGCKLHRPGARPRESGPASRDHQDREREALSEQKMSGRRNPNFTDQEGEAPSEPVSSILGGRAYSRVDHGLFVSV
jgi:hypothetical protein